MNELILLILSMASASAILNMNDWYDRLLSYLKLNRRPFSCPLCLSFWLTIIVGALITKIAISHLIMAGFISAIVAELIWRKLMNMI